MKKLNELVNGRLEVYGFNAFKELENICGIEGEINIISTLSPAIMADMGIMEYYAPVLQRNTAFNTVQEVLDANLDINLINVEFVEDTHSPNYIVSRHQGTVDLIRKIYSEIPLLEGSLTPEDIKGKDIIGTLPPHLIQYCNSYVAITIENFDYKEDGDLSGKELEDRIIICKPIRVTINE